MTPLGGIERIQAILGELYPLPAIPLRHDDPYTLLLAVVLSAQCTDARVNEVAPRLFARARTPEAMAVLSARGAVGPHGRGIRVGSPVCAVRPPSG